MRRAPGSSTKQSAAVAQQRSCARSVRAQTWGGVSCKHVDVSSHAEGKPAAVAPRCFRAPATSGASSWAWTSIA
jgi:hypothetical protein